MKKKVDAVSAIDQPKSILPIWGWLILAGLILWSGYSIWINIFSVESISYPEFLSRLSDGKITQISLQGDEILAIEENDPASPDSNSTKKTRKGLVRTQLPDAALDPALILLLGKHQVAVQIPGNGPILSQLTLFQLPFFLLASFCLFLVIRLVQNGRQWLPLSWLWKFKFEPVISSVRLSEITGIEPFQPIIANQIQHYRTQEKNQKERGISGFLIHGEPGTGKTSLAFAIANEADLTIFRISIQEILRCDPTLTSRWLASILKKIEKSPQLVLFVDDLDALNHPTVPETLDTNQAISRLEETLDRFINASFRTGALMVIAARKPAQVSGILKHHPHEFQTIHLGLPSREDREKILGLQTKGLPLDQDVRLSLLAQATTGASGADLARLCQFAATLAQQKNQATISMTEFDTALDQLFLDPPPQLAVNETDRRMIAYHQAGQILLAWGHPTIGPLQKATIFPDQEYAEVINPFGNHRNNPFLLRRSLLLTYISIILAGKAAEDLVFNDVSALAERDHRSARTLIRHVLLSWGIETALTEEDGSQQDCAQSILRQNREYSHIGRSQIETFLQNQYHCVREELKDNRAHLDQLAEALLEKETLNADEIQQILGPRPVFQNENEEIHRS
jgi:cell division protease FtsH